MMTARPYPLPEYVLVAGHKLYDRARGQWTRVLSLELDWHAEHGVPVVTLPIVAVGATRGRL